MQRCTAIIGQQLTVKKDILDSVATSYAGNVTEAFTRFEGQRPSSTDFYRYIHHVRCGSDGPQWECFFRQLLRSINASCKELQQENAPQQFKAPPVRSNGRPSPQEGTSFSSWYNTTTTSPSASRVSSSSSSGPSHNYARRVSPPAPVDLSKCTIAIKEYADADGGYPEYDYEQLKQTPSIWHCTLDLDGSFVDGIGGSKSEAKHAASQKMCSLLGITV